MGFLYRYFDTIIVSNLHLIILFLVFGSVVFFIYALYGVLVSGKNRAIERIDKFSKEKSSLATVNRLLEEDHTGFVASVANRLHKLDNPKEASRKDAIRLRLSRAGFRSRNAYRNFLSAKLVLALTGPIVYLLLQPAYFLNVKIILTLLGLLFAGYFLPNLVILHYTMKRQEEIFKGLPDALDLMVICVTAGLGLDMTFKRVGEELRSLCSSLSDEFFLTNMEVRAGMQRERSYKNMSKRTAVSEVQGLMGMLIQTSKFGTSLADSLRIHSDGMRLKRRQLAEERAAKTAVKILLPLVAFIFPALLVVIVGPAGIRIAKALLPAMAGG